jgi:hypothetical protein
MVSVFPHTMTFTFSFVTSESTIRIRYSLSPWLIQIYGLRNFKESKCVVELHILLSFYFGVFVYYYEWQVTPRVVPPLSGVTRTWFFRERSEKL